MTTPDEQVRPQIEAAKDYLRAEGFERVGDPPELQTRALFERHEHVIEMWLGTQRRLLYLNLTWLDDRPADQVSNDLNDLDVAQRLRDAPAIRLLPGEQGGTQINTDCDSPG